MLIAEIRRKLIDLEDLDPEEGDILTQLRTMLKETKEDLLTSDVFGALKYLPRNPYLNEVFNAIAERNPHSLGFKKAIEKIKSKTESFDFHFWPSYPTPVGFSATTTEPDVQISGSKILIFIEAKLHSTFSEYQIERELSVGLEQSKGKEFFLVLVTLSTTLPKISFEGHRIDVLNYLKKLSPSSKIPKYIANQLKSNFDRVLSISWQAILSALYTANNQHKTYEGINPEEIRCCTDLIEDLKQLMTMRGIQQFNGFSAIVKRKNKPYLVFPILYCIPTYLPRTYNGIDWESMAWLNKLEPLKKIDQYILHQTKDRKSGIIKFAKLLLKRPVELPRIKIVPWVSTKKEPSNFISITEKYKIAEKPIAIFKWRKE